MTLGLVLLLLPACDVPSEPGDGTSGATTGEPAADDGSSGSSTGDDTTSGDDTAGESTAAGDRVVSTGAEGTGSGGYGGEGTGGTSGEETGMCYGESCLEFGCAAGLVCAEHPELGAPVCVTPCGPPYACNEVGLASCGAVDPTAATCRTDLPVPLCFPA